MSKLNIQDIVGICYPVRPEHANKIFTKKSILFPKMSAHESLPLYLSKGSKFFFYVSHSKKEIVGGGIINNIKVMKVNEFEIYKNRSFLTEEELRNYVGGRIDKKMIVFFIDEIKKFRRAIKLNYYINMGGRYISKKEYARLR